VSCASGAYSAKPAMPPVRQQLRLVGCRSSRVPEVPAGLQTAVHGPHRRLALLVGCSRAVRHEHHDAPYRIRRVAAVSKPS
jgi:hypothetical protein